MPPGSVVVVGEGGHRVALIVAGGEPGRVARLAAALVDPPVAAP